VSDPSRFPDEPDPATGSAAITQGPASPSHRLAVASLGFALVGILAAGAAPWAAWSHRLFMSRPVFYFGEPRTFIYLGVLAVPSLTGIVSGCVAMIQMRRSPARATDRRLATAAIVIGIISLVLSAVAVWAIYVMLTSLGNLKW
jgi:hypothetical protein